MLYDLVCMMVVMNGGKARWHPESTNATGHTLGLEAVIRDPRPVGAWFQFGSSAHFFDAAFHHSFLCRPDTATLPLVANITNVM